MPFDPSTTVAITRRHLPHWEQTGRTYFVTFQLADSLPQDKLRQWKTERAVWLREHPEPHSADEHEEYNRLFTQRFHEWLDTGMGACWLRQPAISMLVEDALRHFDGDRYLLGEYVIMPNHVHVLVTPLGEHTWPAILHSWKSYTAHQINRALERSGPVWQEESFDYLVRHAAQLEKFCRYIEENPLKAGLRPAEYRTDTGGQASSLSRPEDRR